ncbi:MAG: DHA2 family efflux MFS transporter permease subunit [Bdellovibrionales bacterium]
MSRQSALIVFVAVLASLLEIIDASIVNVALPTMMGNLGATLEDISMVVTGYAIANAVVLPVSSWLGDRIGRRKYYLGCILLFTATSVACGFAPNLTCLIIFRICQGLAGGALLPTSQTLIYEQFPKEKAGMAGAIFGMSVMIGPALGPVLGGYLTDEFGWRSIFNVNLPLGMFAFFIGSLVIYNPAYMKDSEGKAKPAFDTIGLALLILGVGCLQYVLERGQSDDWFASSTIVLNSLIAGFCLPMFVWWELRARYPIINVRLFKESVVRYGVMLMLCLGFFLYGVIFALPVFLGITFHYDATQIGAMFIPGSLLTMAMMPVIGRLMQARVNPKLLIFIGFMSLEGCCILMSRFSPLSPKEEILHMLYLRGFALAFLFVPINSSILSQFTGPSLGQVSGLLNLFRQIGGSMGIALVATLLNSLGHQNYLDMSAKVSQLNPMVQNFYMQTSGALSNKMSKELGFNWGSQSALKALYYKVQAQVFMLSFIQLVFVLMMLVGLAFIPLFLLKFNRPVATVADAH